MEYRQLGQDGPLVSAIGLGCMSLAGIYGKSQNGADAATLLGQAVDLGVTFFDTAEAYGPYTNELDVGAALRSVRDRVVIATKFGFVVDPDRQGFPPLDSRPERIKASCDASLKRLGIDSIGLYYQHRVDPTVPIEDVAGTVAELVRAGKVEHFGLSEAAPDTIRRAHAICPVAALQTEYSLWAREPELELLPLCAELGIAFVPYGPLGRGFLRGPDSVGGERNERLSSPRWQPDALSANMALVQSLDQLAKSMELTPAQLALAWVLHQNDRIIPIPGTSRVDRLRENAAAVSLRLTPNQMAAIEAAVPRGAVRGDRYGTAAMATIDGQRHRAPDAI